MAAGGSDHDLSRAVVDASPAAIVAVDMQFRITIWNSAAERMFGWTAEEVLGKPSPIIPERERAALATQLASQHATGDRTSVFIERPRFRKDGSPLHVAVSAAPLVSRSGTPQGAVAVLVDCTQRKSLEEQLRQSQKLDAVGQLAAGVAHEFNNLLTVVRLQTSILLDELPSEDSRRADIKEIQEAAERATSITSQLLTFSRRRLARAEVIDAHQAIAEIAPMIRKLIGDEIEVLLRGRGPCRVILDRTQLEQVIINLALNARDAMPEGGVLTIETRATSRDRVPEAFGRVRHIDFIMITVSDTGVGIADDAREHIFEPFFTTKAPGKGAGLGLSTVYGIVQQAGGYISVETAPRRGTTFSILLPHVLEPRVDDAVAPAVIFGGSEAILVVDDDDSVRRLVSRILTKRGYSVLAASDGIEAISVLRARADIGLVLTDLAMPRMSGSRLAEYLRANEPRVPVLLMSGYPHEGAPSRAGPSAIEGSPILTKPFTEAELAHAVRHAIDASAGRPLQ